MLNGVRSNQRLPVNNKLITPRQKDTTVIAFVLLLIFNWHFPQHTYKTGIKKRQAINQP
jgi:hypothetical protein